MMHEYIADIVGGLHWKGEWNETHKVVTASHDRDSSDETAKR